MPVHRMRPVARPAPGPVLAGASRALEPGRDHQPDQSRLSHGWPVAPCQPRSRCHARPSRHRSTPEPALHGRYGANHCSPRPDISPAVALKEPRAFARLTRAASRAFPIFGAGGPALARKPEAARSAQQL